MSTPRHQRGFTIILAVVMFGLIAVASAMIVHQLGYELRRTRTAYEDAQLRQLLLAGAEDVAANTPQANRPTRKLDLPKTLTGQDASLRISVEKQGSQNSDVRIVARFDGREAIETLHFDEQSHRWLAVRAEE